MSLLAIVLVFVVLAAVLLMAWRTIRFFLKLALIGILLAILLGGLAWWRWTAPTDGASGPAERGRTGGAPARRTR